MRLNVVRMLFSPSAISIHTFIPAFGDSADTTCGLKLPRHYGERRYDSIRVFKRLEAAKAGVVDNDHSNTPVPYGGPRRDCPRPYPSGMKQRGV